MKLSTKIIALIVLVAALGIIFYPTDEKPDLRGDWSISKLLVKGEEKLLTGSITIESNYFIVNKLKLINNYRYKFRIYANDSITICCKEDGIILNDSLQMLSEEDKNLEGRYKIKKLSRIIGGGKSAYYDLKLELKSKNKTIFLSRIEPVQWEEGLPSRGRPQKI
jgi:hypothetical protein